MRRERTAPPSFVLGLRSLGLMGSLRGDLKLNSQIIDLACLLQIALSIRKWLPMERVCCLGHLRSLAIARGWRVKDRVIGVGNLLGPLAHALLPEFLQLVRRCDLLFVGVVRLDTLRWLHLTQGVILGSCVHTLIDARPAGFVQDFLQGLGKHLMGKHRGI